MSQLRDRIHKLVDDLPEGDLDSVEYWLSDLRNEEDPVRRALENAPVDDEPETEEERVAVEEGRADIAAGRVISHGEVLRRLRKAG